MTVMKKFQVGLLIPWVNTAMEEEIPFLVNPGIGLHWSRIRPAVLPRDGHDNSYLEYMLSGIPDALSRFDGLDLQVIVFGCTSASLIESCTRFEAPEAYQHSVFLTAFDTIIFQLNKIQAKTILLFGPYEHSILSVEAGSLQQAGITVRKAVPIEYAGEIRHISADQVCRTFLRESYSKCDAALFSCTALYTLEAIRELRIARAIETPLLSSNTAIADTLNDLYENSSLLKQFSNLAV